MSGCAHCFSELAELTVFCPNCAHANEVDLDVLIDRLIDDRYRVYRRMGQGGLSSVFAATDLRTDRVAVLKISDPAQMVRRESSFPVDPQRSRNYWIEMLERMRREAEQLSTIDHPGIVRILDTGMIGHDLRYVVTEFIHGETLRTLIDRRGRLGAAETIEIVRGIGQILDAVHEAGIVHRDVNPSNIILIDPPESNEESGREDSGGIGPQIKLIDFGISKFPQPAGAPPFTRNSPLRGTVGYSSPEQCRGIEVDSRSDIYSLAVIGYEMLTGQRPFDGRTPTEIALRHIQDEPRSPSSINDAIQPGLDRALLKGLAKNPDERPATAGDLVSQMESGIRQMTISLGADQSAVAATKVRSGDIRKVRRKRRRLAVAAVAAAIALGGYLIADKLLRQIDQTSENAPVRQTDDENIDGLHGSDADSLEIAARSSEQRPTVEARQMKIVTAPIRSGGVARPKADPPVARRANTPARRTKTNMRSSEPASKTPAAPKEAPRRIEPTTSTPRETAASHRPGEIPIPPPITTPPVRSTGEQTGTASRDENGQPADEIRPSVRPRISNPERPAPIGPKLIQWAGPVNRSREIRIEMPGLPGTIDIPRAYRERVAVVEPPNPSNRWKYAILRVFGKGNVAIVIRWWPVQQSQFAEIDGR